MPGRLESAFSLRKINRIQAHPGYAWAVWGLAASFFFAQYFARVAPSVMAPDLMRAFDVTALGLGTLSAFFYYPYVGAQIPVGMILDRFGPHRLLTINTALCALACFIFAYSKELWVAEVARFVMGFSAAFAFVGAVKLATVWFSPTRFGLLVGATQALGMLGAAIGEGPLAVSVEHLGWRYTMNLIGLMLLTLSVMTALIVRDRPKGYVGRPDHVHSSGELFHGIAVVLKNPQTWFLGCFAGLIYAPTTVFAELWGVSYLQVTHHISVELAADVVSCIFVGWAVGGPIAGWFSDKIRRRRPLMLASGVMSFLLMSVALYVHALPVWGLCVVFFLYGIANTGLANAYAASGEINPHRVTGMSVAVVNMASVLVGAMFQPLVGWLLNMQWDGKIVDGIPVYPAYLYERAMILLPICLLLSVVVMRWVKETHCEVVKNAFEPPQEA